MQLVITESKFLNILHKYLKSVYPEFDEMDYTWADFNCGWGVCCDIYAIGFTLPGSNPDDYLFKFVDGENYDDDGDYPDELKGELPEICYEQPDLYDPRFDTLLINEEVVEELDNFFGNINNWEESFLILFNKIYGTNATDVVKFPID
jgi:hypothetical protein